MHRFDSFTDLARVVPPVAIAFAGLALLPIRTVSGADAAPPPYTFTTLAGAANGAGAADGIVSQAQFSGPSGIARDSAGNLYITDFINRTIRKISTTGVVSTLAGAPGLTALPVDGTGTSAIFVEVNGVAVDAAGNVYVTDRHAIRRITSGGVVTTIAGSINSFGSTDGTGTVARFRDPLGIAIDPAGNLVVADTENQTIRKITSAGVVSTFAGSAGSAGFTDATGAAARFKFPTGLAFDAAGNLYVSDTFNYVIRKITSSGAVTTLAGSPGIAGTADGTGETARFKSPRGLTVDATGTVFVTDSGNNTIRRITSTGVVSTLAGDSALGAYVDGVGTAAKFLSPRGIVVEADGSLLVTDNGNHLIRKVAPNRAVTTFAGIPDARGSGDGIGSDAQFNLPRDVAVTNTGVVYVSDANNHTIRKIAPGGEVTLFAGAAGIPGWTDGAAATARFFNPAGLATDAAGNLYVADRSNHTIRKISPNGFVTTIAGIGFQSGANDGLGSAAKFKTPTRVAVDSAGNVYVSDTGNFTIRKITPAGVVTTLAGTAGESGLSDADGPLARFRSPAGLAVDAAGTVYVTDNLNATVRKISPTGAVSTVAGDNPLTGDADGVGGDARFRGPTGLTIDSTGTLYLTDVTNHTIRKITLNSNQLGVVTTLSGLALLPGSADGVGPAARFFSPSGVAVDSAGNIYVADSANHTIRWGATATPARTSAPTAAAIVGQPFSYVATFSGVAAGPYSADGLPPGLTFNPTTGRISGAPTVPGTFPIALSATNGAGIGTGTLTLAITGGNAADEAYAFTTLAGAAGSDGLTNGTGAAARFWNPSGVAVDKAGNVFVADSSNSLIRRISGGGIVTTFAGSPGQPGSANGTGAAARFRIPHAIAVDRSGNLYVTDYGNQTIRKLTSAGVVTTIAGGVGIEGSTDGPGSAARFRYPIGLAVDAAGIVYVADTENHTIRRISLAGEVTTFAGAAGSAGSTDGARSAARFNFPSGIAVDASGNLYVSDASNHTIRKITPSGVVSTFAGTAGSFGFTDGTGTNARFRVPRALALDAAGNLFVADTNNHLIRKVTATGVVTTLGGTAGLRGATNGRGSFALFDEPHGIAVDAAGNLYVADYERHTVRWGALDTPTLASSPVATGSVGQRFSYAARFSRTLVGPYSASSLPPGLTINPVTGSVSGVPTVAGTFAVTLNATNGAGTRGSTLALTISAAPPILTAQPADLIVDIGGPATFSVRAGGTLPLTFQWRRNGIPITGATQASLVLGTTTAADAGNYSVTVSNGLGQVTSAAGVLTVNPLSALANLSVRTTLAAGQTLIVGAVVNGGGKEILVRAAGPALDGFGLAGQADPRIDIFTTGTLPIVGNDNWPDGLSAVFTSLGAFPFAAGSRDAALLEELSGAFTAQARGPGPGTILVEAYDATGGVAPRLINLSARNQVGTGDSVLIAGFNVSGTGTKQLLIRAIGPALTGFGVTGALADPRLQVFNSAGTVVAANDNWEPGLASTFTQVGAFPLTVGSRDAALLLTLNAGASYTIQVDGIGGTTGEALIEIYEVF